MSQRSAVRRWRTAVAVAAGTVAVTAGCGAPSSPASPARVAIATGTTSPSASPTPDAGQRAATALAALPSHGSVTLGPVTRSGAGATAPAVRVAESAAAAATACSDVVAIGSLAPVRADARVSWTLAGATRSMRRGVVQTALAAAVASDCRTALARDQDLVVTAPLNAATVGTPGTMRLEVRRGGSAARPTLVVTVTYAAT